MTLVTTVSATDLTSPTGELDRVALFPRDTETTFAERLSAYITQGETKANAAGVTSQTAFDAAVVAWAYHRAYKAVAQRLYADPQQATIEGEGSARYDKSQAAYFDALADTKLAEYEQATESPATTDEPSPTSSIRTRFTGWGYGGGTQ